MTKSDEFQTNAEECQRMAELAPTDREKRSWMKLGEAWLRMIEIRTVIVADSPKQTFDAALEKKGTGQSRSDKSN